MFKAAVLTVSDRSFQGERPDEGGPLVAEILKNAGYEVAETAIVPDEKGRGGKAREASAHQPGLFVLRALGSAGAGERFIISVGVIHCVPPVRRALPARC